MDLDKAGRRWRDELLTAASSARTAVDLVAAMDRDRLALITTAGQEAANQHAAMMQSLNEASRMADGLLASNRESARRVSDMLGGLGTVGATRDLVGSFALRETTDLLGGIAKKLSTPASVDLLGAWKGDVASAFGLDAWKSVASTLNLDLWKTAASTAPLTAMLKAFEIPPGLKDFGISPPEIERIRQDFDQWQQQIDDAPDEKSKWAAAREALQGIAEAITSAEYPATTPKQRAKNAALYVMFACWVISYVLAQLDNRAIHAELRELRHGQEQILRLQQREQERHEKAEAEIKGQLAIMQRLLEERASQTAPPAGPLCRVADPATLRTGPSGSTDRVMSLAVGTMLRHVTKADRWYFVEVLNADGSTSDVRGWVYRRNVRIITCED